MYLNVLKNIRKITACNQLDLEALGNHLTVVQGPPCPLDVGAFSWFLIYLALALLAFCLKNKIILHYMYMLTDYAQKSPQTSI